MFTTETAYSLSQKHPGRVVLTNELRIALEHNLYTDPLPALPDWVTNLEGVFYKVKCSVLDLTQWDVSKVDMMNSLFAYCSASEIKVGNWDTSSVVAMSQLFRECVNLEKVDVGDWNVSQVKDMSGMFYECESLKELDLSRWNTGNVVTFSAMFFQCKLKKLNVSTFDTSKAESLEAMFTGNSELAELDVIHWNTRGVRTIARMFHRCTKLKVLDVADWDISKVSDVEDAFSHMHVMTHLYLFEWKGSRNTNTRDVFRETPYLSRVPAPMSWYHSGLFSPLEIDTAAKAEKMEPLIPARKKNPEKKMHERGTRKVEVEGASMGGQAFGLENLSKLQDRSHLLNLYNEHKKLAIRKNLEDLHSLHGIDFTKLSNNLEFKEADNLTETEYLKYLDEVETFSGKALEYLFWLKGFNDSE